MKRRLLILGLVAVALAVTVAFFFMPARTGSLVVKKVLIDVSPAAVAANVDREHVRALVDSTLDDIRGVTVDAAAAGVILRVRIESMVVATPPAGSDDVAGTSTLALGVEVLDAADGGRPIGRGHSVATARGLMDPDALVSQALRDAVQQVLAARAADSLDSDVLLSWLADPATPLAQQRKAMQALASRGERRATAPIVALLENNAVDDEGNPTELALAAVQALSVLGDPDANDAVIAFSERQSPAVRKLCIDAVRASRAENAVAWLFTLTWGHPDPDVQAAARAALLELKPDALGDVKVAGAAPAAVAGDVVR